MKYLYMMIFNFHSKTKKKLLVPIENTRTIVVSNINENNQEEIGFTNSSKKFIKKNYFNIITYLLLFSTFISILIKNSILFSVNITSNILFYIQQYRINQLKQIDIFRALMEIFIYILFFISYYFDKIENLIIIIIVYFLFELLLFLIEKHKNIRIKKTKRTIKIYEKKS